MLTDFLQTGISPLLGFFPFIVVMDGVHCGIYTGFYNVSNISYMNLPPACLAVQQTFYLASLSKQFHLLEISLGSSFSKGTVIKPPLQAIN
jgi:hypothetical protein